MKEIIAYEMVCDKTLEYRNDIICVPFLKRYWNEYMKIYNECFYKMRKALEVEPINFYYDYSQVIDKINDIFLYLQNGEIIPPVVLPSGRMSKKCSLSLIMYLQYTVQAHSRPCRGLLQSQDGKTVQIYAAALLWV